MLKFKNGERILFTGDSITDAGRGRPVGEGLWEGVGNGFVRTVETMLNVYYPELYLRISNTGTAGDNSRTLTDRWQAEVLELKPDYIYCEIGINDVWRQFDSPAVSDICISPVEYEKNLCSMAETAADSGAVLVFMTPYYMEPCKQDIMRIRMCEYAEIMKKTAKKYGIECIDLQAVFDEYLKYRHSSYIMWDRVHPGYIGSLLIARVILKQMGFDKPLV